MKSDLAVSLSSLRARLAALVAHAAHDGVEVRRARARFERTVGDLRVERLIEVELLGASAAMPGSDGSVFAGSGSFLENAREMPPSMERTRLPGSAGVLSLPIAATAASAAASAGERLGATARQSLRADRPCAAGRRQACISSSGSIDGASLSAIGRFVGMHAGGGRLVLQRAEPLDDLEQRVVDRLEGLGVALVRTPGQVLERLQVARERVDGGSFHCRAREGADGIFGGQTRRFQDRFTGAGERLLDVVQPRPDVLEFAQALSLGRDR